MQALCLLVLVVCLSFSLCSAFLPSRRALNVQRGEVQQEKQNEKLNPIVGAAVNVLAGASLALTPWPVLADDQNVFVVPLAVSLFTMVPFLYYQQALKPKARTVQQIELDENLKPLKGNKSVGASGQAKAGKKTK